MKKLKVYLDTSVISYLLQDDAPEKMQETRALWEMFEAGKYDVYLSQVTLDEIDDCPEPKRTTLYEYLGKIRFTNLQLTQEAVDVAKRIINMGILTQKSQDDSHHIAIAVVNECDCILSWNFKHMVNIKTIKGVRAVSQLEGYKDIEIINPSTLLGGEE